MNQLLMKSQLEPQKPRIKRLLNYTIQFSNDFFGDEYRPLPRSPGEAAQAQRQLDSQVGIKRVTLFKS